MATEQQTTPEGVIAALDDLLKSVDADGTLKGKLDALKKGGIENTGFYTEGKTQGGGQADSGDQGGIETLMIAKMTALGIDAGQQGQLVGFLTGLLGKAAPGMGEGEPDGDEDDDPETAGMSAEAKAAYMKGLARAKKSEAADPDDALDRLAKSGSAMERFRQNPEIAGDIDAAPFMSALVHEVTTAFDTLAKSLAGARTKDQALIKSMGRVIATQAIETAEQKKVIDELGRRLGIVERTPQPQRGVTGARALAKSAALGGAGEPVEQLSKGEVLSTLSYLNLVKGQKQINGFRTVDLITDAEASDVIDQPTLTAVAEFLRDNPKEAEAAKTF